jgi:hypothetical protein
MKIDNKIPTTAISIPEVVKPASKIQLTVSLVKLNGALRFITFIIHKPNITDDAMISARFMDIKIVIAILEIKGYFFEAGFFRMSKVRWALPTSGTGLPAYATISPPFSKGESGGLGKTQNSRLRLVCATYEQLMVCDLDLWPGLLTVKERGLAAKSRLNRRKSNGHVRSLGKMDPANL